MTTFYAVVALLPVLAYMRIVADLIASDRIGVRVAPRRLLWCPELEPAPALVKAIRAEWAADFAATRIVMAAERNATLGRPSLAILAVAHRDARQPMAVAA